MPDKEWLPFLPMGAWKNTRLNHKSSTCTGSSKSLCVTKDVHGNLKAKCYRCGEWGSRLVEGYTPPIPLTSKIVPAKMMLPSVLHDWLSFPIEARLWLLRAGIGQVLAEQWNIKWSERYSTLVIPIMDGEELVGVVHRGFNADNRYRLLTNDSSRCFLRGPPIAGSPVVLCEDALSAMRLIDAGFNGVALLGLHMRNGVRSMCAELRPPSIVVWLDNDNSNVVRAASRLAKEFPYLLVRVVRAEKDPKHYSTDKIKEILWKILS